MENSSPDRCETKYCGTSNRERFGLEQCLLSRSGLLSDNTKITRFLVIGLDTFLGSTRRCRDRFDQETVSNSQLYVLKLRCELVARKIHGSLEILGSKLDHITKEVLQNFRDFKSFRRVLDLAEHGGQLFVSVCVFVFDVRVM